MEIVLSNKGGLIMKGYDMNKIIHQVKEAERKAKAIERLINHLLPSNTKELNECIALNNMLDNDY